MIKLFPKLLNCIIQSVLSQGNLGPTIAVDYSKNPVYTHLGYRKAHPELVVD